MEKNPHKIHRLRSSSIDGFSRPPSLMKKNPKPKTPIKKIGSPLRTRPVSRESNFRTKSAPIYPTTYMKPKVSENLNRPRRPVNVSRSKINSKKHPIERSLLIRRIIAGFLALIMLISFTITGFLGYKFLKTSEKIFGGSFISNVGSIFGSGTPLNGENSGRVNILLAGDSADDAGHAGAQLTDSILILSINTKDKSALLLSIPRDLWVKMPPGVWPGNTYQKINAANEISNFSQPGYPNGGMGALSYVIQNEIGIPINYYGLINYSAFRDAVNAVGGVTITIKSPDPRGLYDINTNTKLPNGQVTLNGEQALNLARSRGDGYNSYGFPGSDFNRTQYQRQLLIAVAKKAQSAGVIADPSKVSKLFNALGNNLLTNLSLPNVMRAISLTKNIDTNTISSYSFCSTMTVGSGDCKKAILTSYQDPGSGQSALSPIAGVGNFGQLAQYYQKITSNNPVTKEGASVEILNGTNSSGLALNAKNYTANKGVFIVDTGDASTIYPKTTIIDNSAGKDPATLALLKSIFGINVTTKQLEGNYTSDFVVVLGNNYTLK